MSYVPIYYIYSYTNTLTHTQTPEPHSPPRVAHRSLCEGILIILTVLRCYATRADIQAQGCGALMNLAQDAAAKVKMNTAGAMPVILEALRAHPASRAMQMRA